MVSTMRHKALPALGCMLLVVMLAACGGGASEADIEATVEARGEDDYAAADSSKGRFPINYTGFTHTPVDFNHLFSEEARCPHYSLAIQPYFNHFITNHAEGPMKWYLATCSDKPTKIFLPVTALLYKEVNGNPGSIRIMRDTVTGGFEGTIETYHGQNVLTDVLLYA